MRLVDHVRSVRHTFAANRGRSTLTLLGIVIGAGSIVLLAGLLKGGEEALMSTNQGANESDLVKIRRDEPPAKQLYKTRRELSHNDEGALRESRLLDGVEVASEMNHESQAFWRDKKKRVRLVGATPAAPELYRLQLEKGRFLLDEDLTQRRRVAVIGQEIWQELLDKRELDGVDFTADGQKWTVVGVLKNKPLLGGGGDGTWMWNRKVLVPQTTFDAVFQPDHTVNRLFVRLHGNESLVERVAAIKNVVSGTLLRRHFGVSNFKVMGDESEAQQFRLILLIIKILLLGTGLLSLLVGGINIMNIMLVTVTERTREIGVRRAIGAPPSAILIQFLLEASFIALTGGVIGVVGGMGLSWLVALGLGHALGGWNLHVELWSIVLGLSLSLGTGVVFGLFPAWRAARLDPVEALRYE